MGYLDHVLVCLVLSRFEAVILTKDSVSYGCSFIGGQSSSDYDTAAFRIPWGIQMVPAICLFAAMMFLPESPRWLARKDRWEDCHSVLTLVHGKGDPSSPFVALELEDIKAMCEFERLHKDVTYLDLFKPAMLNRTFIGIFMQIWSQLTGMNVMSMFFDPYSFETKLTSLQCTTFLTSLEWLDTQATPTSSPHPSNTLSTWS
jgi:hypothetical protein